MGIDKLYFKSLREDRGTYFVEYSPPVSASPFATLAVVLLESKPLEEIVLTMEREAADWTNRFCVPLMATAFDEADSVASLEPMKASNSIIGWRDAGGALQLHWRLLSNAELPNGPLASERLLAIYGSQIPYDTQKQVAARVAAYTKDVRRLKFVVLVYAVVIPVTITILGFANAIVGAVTTLWSLFEGFTKWRELTGRKRKSLHEIQREQDTLAMRHHDYYCRENPEGFKRLKAEVLDRKIRASLQREVQELRQTPPAE